MSCPVTTGCIYSCFYMPSTIHEIELLEELIKALENKNSALGTYFRSLSKEQMKELFKNESTLFLTRGIAEFLNLEDYELCAVFREILDEREVNTICI